MLIGEIDGLLDPLGYLERLRAEVKRRAPARDGRGEFPIVVEKILTPGEQLRKSWPVQGTTGYEFLNDLEDAFLHADGYDKIEHGYRALRRLTNGRFPDFAHAGKIIVTEASWSKRHPSGWLRRTTLVTFGMSSDGGSALSTRMRNDDAGDENAQQVDGAQRERDPEKWMAQPEQRARLAVHVPEDRASGG